MSRYTGPIRYRGPASARASTEAGRKLLGDLVARTPPGGVNQARKVLPDGSVVTAQLAGDQRLVAVTPPPAGPPPPPARGEEMVWLYISSATGLQVIDLGTKAVVSAITGLEDFEVDAVSPNGRIVHMSGSGVAVRVDLSTLEAFGVAYTVDATVAPGSGRALPNGGTLSPDGSRFLLGFGQTIHASTFAALDSLGGYLLVDATTLLAVRPAIRMGFRPEVACWADDSQHFFTAASLNADPGDVASPDVTTSTDDYVAMFDRDGALVQALLVKHWDNPSPDAGFSRLVQGLASSGDRLYVLRWGEAGFEGNTTELLVVGLDGGAMTGVLGSATFAGLATNPSLSHGSGTLTAYIAASDEVIGFDVTGETPVEIGRATHATLVTDADDTDEWKPELIQRGPRSRIGREPDRRRYFLARNGLGSAALHGFRSFVDPPVYTLPLDTLNVGQRYRLISAGPRVLP